MESSEICWHEEFIGSKPNFSIKFYEKETGTIVDVREIPAPNHGMAVKWASENGPAECGCLITPM
jgi:hypothetical protein